MEGDLKLNIGSSNPKGSYKSPDWINFDLFKANGVNVVGSGEKLPFKTSCFSTIHCVHVLEHLTRDKFPIMLREISRVLAKDGEVYIEVPDFERTVELLHKAYLDKNHEKVHIWRTSVYGKTERPGMAHHFGFDESTLTKYMLENGFTVVNRLNSEEQMISRHYKLEPVLLVVGRKN